MTTTKNWWEAPEEGEEFHTANVWNEIAKAASAAGDETRAQEAREAAEFEERNS